MIDFDAEIRDSQLKKTQETTIDFDHEIMVAQVLKHARNDHWYFAVGPRGTITPLLDHTRFIAKQRRCIYGRLKP